MLAAGLIGRGVKTEALNGAVRQSQSSRLTSSDGRPSAERGLISLAFSRLGRGWRGGPDLKRHFTDGQQRFLACASTCLQRHPTEGRSEVSGQQFKVCRFGNLFGTHRFLQPVQPDTCRVSRMGTRRVALHSTHLMSVARQWYERSGYRRYEAIDFSPVPGFLVMGFAKDLIDIKENA